MLLPFPMHAYRFHILAVLASLLFLTGCEQLGFTDPAKLAAAREAEGKAIGGACRHSGRALEDCYALNPKAMKSAIFAGWRDMDGYMRENKIEVVQPVQVEPVSSHDAKTTAEVLIPPPVEINRQAAEQKKAPTKKNAEATLPATGSRRIVS